MNPRILFVLLAAGGVTACGTPSGSAQPESPAVAVTTSVVTAAPWTSPFEAGGVVLARHSAGIASRVLAPVRAVHVRAGDRVRRGQLLVELETTDLTAHATRAAAEAGAAAEAAAGATAGLSSAEAALALARATHKRVSALQADRSATAQELDDAVAALAAADASVAGARARVNETRSGLDAARAGVRAADITAEFGSLVAPFDGLVAERLADPGAMAVPGQPLLTVEDPSAFRLEVRLDASRIGAAVIGRTVQVCVDAAGACRWQDGRVTEVARLDPSTHSFAVKIELAPGAGSRSGLFGRARFAGDARQALTLPAAAIVQRGQIAYAYVVTADGHAQLRALSLGSSDGERIEVLDGLQPGERVVVSPPASLQDGARVTVSTPAPAVGRRP